MRGCCLPPVTLRHVRRAVINVGRCASFGVDKKAAKQSVTPKKPAKKLLLSTWRQYKPVAWLFQNAMKIAACQLLIESTLTLAIATLLAGGWVTAGDVRALLNRLYYPFTGIVNWDGGYHEVGLTVVGYQLTRETLSVLHTSYNVASGLLPLQLVILALVYPTFTRVCGKLFTRFRTNASSSTNQTISIAAERVAHSNPFGKRRHYRK
ncbi:hypothetical protein TRVL_05911 [Trypanosoma vivax]|uniref:Uncharacterized protein n=1 Tax=Trypanosoma vivax (strain Y486) TaxID=1055687 RepID=G0U5K1_TRYVY|nr:hypothetical protein TRVL_05911 [Trypanosoma vivax]CCC51152.1 conserved hypothetical protein [Trypanosoma vivax Y486]